MWLFFEKQHKNGFLRFDTISIQFNTNACFSFFFFFSFISFFLSKHGNPPRSMAEKDQFKRKLNQLSKLNVAEAYKEAYQAYTIREVIVVNWLTKHSR